VDGGPASVDAARRAAGFLTIAELAELAKTCRVFDPFSTLISRSVELAPGNILYPSVVIEAVGSAHIAIGAGNVFWPGTVVHATGGEISIGERNSFGPGGVTIRLEEQGRIAIGSEGRFRDGAGIFAGCILGDGAQVLGPIQAQDCMLGAGGSHAEPDPDLRGGVLKGVGRARGLRVGRGEVILGEGRFEQGSLKPQSHYHPAKSS
jgi:carbonic anhydrase/acetyltransferase-like protein (isoleucine patch superfamily)